MSGWAPVLAGGLVAAIAARALASVALRRAPASVIRTNVDGDEVPAILGWPLVAGAVAGAVIVGAWTAVDPSAVGCSGGRCLALNSARELRMGPGPLGLVVITLMAVVGMFLAGLWDDLRGDERPRGFAGHLAAARTGAVTGGIVKLVVGVVVSLATIAALGGWDRLPLVDWVLLALPLALSANLTNLFDRAPGRALKVFLAVAVPLALSVPSFRLVAAGTVGAALALLGVDLKAKGMLGDAGANPLGTVLGLGMIFAVIGDPEATSDPRPALAAVVILLLALNLASERWSFSRIIEATPSLARLDQLGRK